MPYAKDNKISTDPIEGGIEISDEQYKQALKAQVEGRTVAIRGEELRILSAEKITVYNTEDKSEKQIAENDDVPEGYTDIEPDKFDTWNGDAWVEDTEAKKADQWEKLRNKRDQLLSQTDWAVLPDSPHDTEAIRNYRQELRDLPQKTKLPEKVVWPTNPLNEG